MSYSQPRSAPAGRTHLSRSTARQRHRRRIALLLLLLLTGYVALPLGGGGSTGPTQIRISAARPGPAVARASAPVIRWPEQGQAAVVVDEHRSSASPREQPVPIASLAKVMTAYLTLRRDPITGPGDGFGLVVTSAQAQEEARDAAENQSGVAVRAGERLTERQLLEALLVPSANNVARMLAVRLAGGVDAFVAQMNAEARALGMAHTVYTDPSGFDPGTVSTAADQLRLFQAAMRLPLFGQIAAMPRVTLPVAGTLANFNPLVGEGYVGKTGSDAAAGGCLAFRTRVASAGRRETVTGVVLGQGQGSDTTQLLAAAARAAHRLVGSSLGAGAAAPVADGDGSAALPVPGPPIAS